MKFLLAPALAFAATALTGCDHRPPVPESPTEKELKQKYVYEELLKSYAVDFTMGIENNYGVYTYYYNVIDPVTEASADILMEDKKVNVIIEASIPVENLSPDEEKYLPYYRKQEVWRAAREKAENAQDAKDLVSRLRKEFCLDQVINVSRAKITGEDALYVNVKEAEEGRKMPYTCLRDGKGVHKLILTKPSL